ncbi:MAG: response regulator [Rhodospirillaceae bacterium]|nr:response regulator [Rhodospirillaceae bacterium]
MTETKGPDYGGKKFLVADDKAFVRGLVQSMLLRLNVRHIKHAANGREAIAALQSAGGQYDCILSDWNMEPVSGLELLRTVRCGAAGGARPDTCFIMLTGHADADVVKSAMALDVNGYLVKPVSFEKLSKAVMAAFSKPINVKPPADYHGVGLVETPKTVPELVKPAPPWILWVKRDPKERVDNTRLDQIRQEAAKTSRVTIGAARLKNIERRPIDQVKSGMVLAESIYSEDGMLLLAEGIVLSPGLLARLRDLAAESGEDVTLRVGEQ